MANNGRTKGCATLFSSCLTESEEQRILFQWRALQLHAHPDLRLLFHVPNEGRRSYATGARMKAEGMTKGVPDLWLPVARGAYHGLVIELKRRDRSRSRISPEQRKWISDMTEQGWCAAVCYGAEDAIDLISRYIILEGKQ